MKTFVLVAVSFLGGFFACRLTRKPCPPPPEPPKVRTVIAMTEHGTPAGDMPVIRQADNEDGSVRVFVRAAAVTSRP